MISFLNNFPYSSSHRHSIEIYRQNNIQADIMYSMKTNHVWNENPVNLLYSLHAAHDISDVHQKTVLITYTDSVVFLTYLYICNVGWIQIIFSAQSCAILFVIYKYMSGSERINLVCFRNCPHCSYFLLSLLVKERRHILLIE